MPTLLDTLARGSISLQHRDRILGIDNPRVHERLVADHAIFVEWAETLTWVAFDMRVVAWLQVHDPDGVDPGEERRGLSFSQTWANEFVLNGRMGAVKGTIVGTELNRLYDILFKADWRESKERLGRDPHDHELGRTPPQRRLDALVLAFERSATGPEEGRKGVILACILLGPDAARWLCEFTTGTRIRPGQLTPHVDDVTFETFLFGEGMRDVSVSRQRCFVEALRRAAQPRAGSASTPTATDPPANVRSITRCPTPTAGRPPSPTANLAVPSTTAPRATATPSTKAQLPRTGSPRSRIGQILVPDDVRRRRRGRCPIRASSPAARSGQLRAFMVSRSSSLRLAGIS